MRQHDSDDSFPEEEPEVVYFKQLVPSLVNTRFLYIDTDPFNNPISTISVQPFNAQIKIQVVGHYA